MSIVLSLLSQSGGEAISSYSALITAITNTPGYDDQASNAPLFIALAEEKIQVEAKLAEYEATATVAISAGSGGLPSDFLGMKTVYWDGDLEWPLDFISLEQYDAMRANGSDVARFYTISGNSILTTPMGDGSVVCTYSARFTPLSEENPTNEILSKFPSAYLFGALHYAAISIKDNADMEKYGILFNAALKRMDKNNQDRKYGGPLQMRVR